MSADAVAPCVARPSADMVIVLGKWVHIFCEEGFPLAALSMIWEIDGLMQERRNSIANALELHLSSTNPSIW